MNKEKIRTGEELDDFLEEVLENALTPDEDSAVQDLIDVVTFKNRTIILNDVKNNYTGSQIYQNILIWNILDAGKVEKEPIKIYIDSYGGSIIDAFEVIDAIKASKIPVYTIVTGAAYSSGLFIALAGDKRMAYEHTSFLLHEGSIGSGMQDAHKFKKYAEFYNTQLQQLKDHIIKNSNITEEDYDKMSKDDNWFTAQQALDLGFIDEIINTIC